MITPTFKDHFSGCATNYAAHRPTYPVQLVEELARISPRRALALDCGCGTGQLSVLLADRFDEVVATDASHSQIEKAQPHERVRYRTSLAEESGLPDSSVDLVTVAQAAHWLDLPKVYAEVRRVARPNAVICLITYGVLHVEGEVDSLVQRFYWETIGPHWPPERRHVEDGYRSLPFPFPAAQLPELAIEVSWRLNDLVGYINTWSAVKAAEKALGMNPAEQFEKDLRPIWGDPTARRQVKWPLSLRAGYV